MSCISRCYSRNDPPSSCKIIVRRPDFNRHGRKFIVDFIEAESGRLQMRFRPSCCRIPYSTSVLLVNMSIEPGYLWPSRVILHHLVEYQDYIFGSRLTIDLLSGSPFIFDPVKVMDRDGEPISMHGARLLELAVMDLFFYYPRISDTGKQIALSSEYHGRPMYDWIVVNTFPDHFHDDWHRLFCSLVEHCVVDDWFQVFIFQFCLFPIFLF